MLASITSVPCGNAGKETHPDLRGTLLVAMVGIYTCISLLLNEVNKE